jgi:hypothetical protein
MSGFSFRKSIDGNPTPIMKEIVGANSIVFQRGDAIRVNTGGFAALVTEGVPTLGIVVGVVDSKGINVEPTTGLDTWTMASDNQTVNGYKVQYIPALPQYLFFNDADGSLAVANLFQYADLLNENQVKTSTLTDTATCNVQLVEVDPDGDADASKGLFRFVETFWATAAGSITA